MSRWIDMIGTDVQHSHAGAWSCHPFFPILKFSLVFGAIGQTLGEGKIRGFRPILAALGIPLRAPHGDRLGTVSFSASSLVLLDRYVKIASLVLVYSVTSLLLDVLCTENGCNSAMLDSKEHIAVARVWLNTVLYYAAWRIAVITFYLLSRLAIVLGLLTLAPPIITSQDGWLDKTVVLTRRVLAIGFWGFVVGCLLCYGVKFRPKGWTRALWIVLLLEAIITLALSVYPRVWSPLPFYTLYAVFVVAILTTALPIWRNEKKLGPIDLGE